MSNLVSNTKQSFEQWYAQAFNEDYKTEQAGAIREGLKILRNQTIANVNASGFKKANQIAMGTVLSVDKDNATGKVHILGKRGDYAGYLRIFELGTYKSNNVNAASLIKMSANKRGKALRHKNSIKARYFFTDAQQQTANEVPQKTMEALKIMMEKRGFN